MASVRTRNSTRPLLKPIALRMATSEVRSRMAIAMALPATKRSETTTAAPMP